MILSIKKLLALTLLLFLSLNAITNAHASKSIFDLSTKSLFKTDNSFVDVDQAFQFNFNQSKRKITVTFTIKEGYYLYRHQFRFPVKNAKISPVILPKGIDHKDDYFGVQQIYENKLSVNILVLQADKNASITIRYQGCAKKGLCYPPTTKVITIPPFSSIATTETSESNAQAVLTALNRSSTPTQSIAPKAPQQTVVTQASDSEQNKLASMLKQNNLWLTLVAFFIGGLLLSFTPCVFPMYPILTGIIVGQGDKITTKKAFTLSFFYVQGMAITYTLLGIVVALAGAQFQAVFQSPYVLVTLSILFVFLALSMFGVFNLALPSSWQNKLNALSGKQKGGSIIGVIIMGVISGLVASPCTTAPLTGALLYISQTGNVLLGASALYALSLGMGLPLLILGSSGGKLLPKAGNWMNIIKNIFGLLLLAVPILLLSRMIPPIIVQWLWAILLLISAAYFYVVNQHSINNKANGFWYGLRSLVIFIALFFGSTQVYQLIFPHEFVAPALQNQQHINTFTKVANLAELKQAVKQANANGKTVMVDFYADWCIACKEFEHNTFNKPQVTLALANTKLIQVDLTDTLAKRNVKMMDHFKIFGLPSILFFNLKGEELTNNRVTGFMNASEFSQHINKLFKQK